MSEKERTPKVGDQYSHRGITRTIVSITKHPKSGKKFAVYIVEDAWGEDKLYVSYLLVPAFQEKNRVKKTETFFIHIYRGTCKNGPRAASRLTKLSWEEFRDNNLRAATRLIKTTKVELEEDD